MRTSCTFNQIVTSIEIIVSKSINRNTSMIYKTKDFNAFSYCTFKLVNIDIHTSLTQLLTFIYAIRRYPRLSNQSLSVFTL